MSYRTWVILLCVSALGVQSAAADTVTLKDGTTVQGATAVKAGRVIIETTTGTLTLPAWRVASVQGKLTRRKRPEPTREPGAATERSGALEGRLTIKAQDVLLAQLLARISRESGADIRAVSDVREPGVRVSVDVQDVPVSEALRRVLEGTPYRLRVRPDGLFEIRRAAREPQVTVADVLERRIDVDFDGVPLSDVLSYIQEVTGVNMVVSNEVRLSGAPVVLTMRSARVETMLELALEPHGFDYAVRPGQVLFVGEESEVRQHVFRVYPVTDLLLNRGGTSAPGAGGLPGTRGTAGGGLNPQFGGARSSGQAFIRGGSTAGGGQGAGQMALRAGDLILLIQQICGRGTWREPNSTGTIGAGALTGQ